MRCRLLKSNDFNKTVWSVLNLMFNRHLSSPYCSPSCVTKILKHVICFYCTCLSGHSCEKKGCNVSRWTCDTVKHPKQVDATSCGVFALKVRVLTVIHTYIREYWKCCVVINVNDRKRNIR